MEKNMFINKYIDFVISALKEIDASYLRVKTLSNDIYEKQGFIVYRERVFCYEFYHQLRCLQNRTSTMKDIDINGEIDKTYSKYLSSKNLAYNPDIIIHKQGSCEDYVVIEVKNSLKGNNHSNRVAEIKKDFEKIKNYMEDSHLKYQNGVFIICNNTLAELKNFLETHSIRQNVDIKDDLAKNIYLMSCTAPKNISDLSDLKQGQKIEVEVKSLSEM